MDSETETKELRDCIRSCLSGGGKCESYRLALEKIASIVAIPRAKGINKDQRENWAAIEEIVGNTLNVTHD